MPTPISAKIRRLAALDRQRLVSQPRCCHRLGAVARWSRASPTIACDLPRRGSGGNWYGAAATAGQPDPCGRLRGFFASYAREPSTWVPGNTHGHGYLHALEQETMSMEWLTALVIELAGAVGFFALWVGLFVLDQPRPPACSPRPHTAGRATGGQRQGS
jgi:hypothetical protein